MLQRLVGGLVLGIVIGGIAAAILIVGLGMPFFTSAIVAYAAAAVTGVLTGLIAGKPIWSPDGRIEAGLKAIFGTLLALFGMFALRQWVHFAIDLEWFHAGVGQLGDLPATSLPILAAVLAGFFELDNTPSSDGDAKQGRQGKQRIAGSNVRVAGGDADDDNAEAETRAEKKGRTR
ncbi:MAG: hypothetical protein FWD73_15430 [Polyangiaceae bacterium]|nr:hypothetical protein [Polyangiaceae bacterium]